MRIRTLVAPLAAILLAAGAQAATVTAEIDFTTGTIVNEGGGVKNYFEDGFVFFDARIVGGPCAEAGADKCAALNKHETTIMEREDGGAFDLLSIWFYLNGKASKGTNSLMIFETGNAANFVEFTQPTWEHNTPYVEPLSFLGVTSLTFVSGSTGDKNEGNARFDSLGVAYTVPDPDPPIVPLPATALLLLGGLGGLAAVRRR